MVVWLEQKFQGQWRKLTRALFLMASRNATNTKSLAVNELIPATDEEKAIYDGGESNQQICSIGLMIVTIYLYLIDSKKKEPNPKPGAVVVQYGTECRRTKDDPWNVCQDN